MPSLYKTVIYLVHRGASWVQCCHELRFPNYSNSSCLMWKVDEEFQRMAAKWLKYLFVRQMNGKQLYN